MRFCLEFIGVMIIILSILGGVGYGCYKAITAPQKPSEYRYVIWTTGAVGIGYGTNEYTIEDNGCIAFIYYKTKKQMTMCGSFYINER